MKSIGLLSVEPLLKSNELVSALKKLALNPRKVSRYKADIKQSLDTLLTK